MAKVPLQTQIYSFLDYYNNKVELAFENDFFSNDVKHVWVICRFRDQWLLTCHSERGIEFPGGKVEVGETAKQAAIREVFEETGGVISEITYIGQYKVTAKQDIVIKNIYFAKVSELEKKQDYLETKGPVLLRNLPKQIKNNPNYSFIMKDDVLPKSISWLEKNFLK